MNSSPAITLRYFNCRGRAQHLRSFLTHRKLDFSDQRVAIADNFAEWQDMKSRTGLAGWFGKLPVLQYGDQLICETSVISGFLLNVTGDAALLGEQQSLQHSMLTSSLCNDLMNPLGILIWAELAFPGSKLEQMAPAALGRIQAHLQQIETTLSDWSWWQALPQRELTVTDFLLWEMLSIALLIFSDALNLPATRNLCEFHDKFRARALCEQMLAEQPGPYTACPVEGEVISRIQSLA